MIESGMMLLSVVGLCLAAFLFGVLVGSEPPAKPETSARTAEVWTPCEPPRPGVECWRSGHAVVCLPEEVKP